MLGRNKNQLKNVRHKAFCQINSLQFNFLSLKKGDEATYKSREITFGMVVSAFSSSLLELNCPLGGGLTW